MSRFFALEWALACACAFFLISDAAAAPAERADVRRAVELKRGGRPAEALALYEKALAADRSVLALPHAGLLDDLVAAYRARAAKGTPADTLALAELLDMTGRVGEAKDLYRTLVEGAPADVARRAREDLDALVRERETYDRWVEELRGRAERERLAEEAATLSRLAEEERLEAEARAAAAREQELAAEAAAREELEARLARAESELAAAEREVWRTKRDWAGREGARTWRAKPGEPAGSYDNTLRRRYRQAKAGAEAKRREVESLKGALENDRGDPGAR